MKTREDYFKEIQKELESLKPTFDNMIRLINEYRENFKHPEDRLLSPSFIFLARTHNIVVAAVAGYPASLALGLLKHVEERGMHDINDIKESFEKLREIFKHSGMDINAFASLTEREALLTAKEKDEGSCKDPDKEFLRSWLSEARMVKEMLIKDKTLDKEFIDENVKFIEKIATKVEAILSGGPILKSELSDLLEDLTHIQKLIKEQEEKQEKKDLSNDDN